MFNSYTLLLLCSLSILQDIPFCYFNILLCLNLATLTAAKPVSSFASPHQPIPLYLRKQALQHGCPDSTRHSPSPSTSKSQSNKTSLSMRDVVLGGIYFLRLRPHPSILLSPSNASNYHQFRNRTTTAAASTDFSISRIDHPTTHGSL